MSRFASLDLISGGRSGWNLVTSANDSESKNFGREDHLPKAVRYRRAREFVDVVRGLWDSWDDDAFVFDKASGRFYEPDRRHVLDHHGEFYRIEGAYSDIKPYQQPYPRVFFGGSSEGALEMGAKHCDVFAIFGEPLAETRARLVEQATTDALTGLVNHATFHVALADAVEGAIRDHRRLATDLDLLSFPEQLGGGLAVWHPKGGIVRKLMEDYSRERHAAGGYEHLVVDRLVVHVRLPSRSPC